MHYKKVKFGKKERVTFSKVKNEFELKDLLEIQMKSYQEFLDKGIEEVFSDLFPIENFSGTLSLELGKYHFEKPRHTIKECRDRDLTYAMPLKVLSKLTNHVTGEVIEKEIFLGDIPAMTDSGSFVINGAERCVVLQLVRSPSVYFTESKDKNERELIECQMIPNRGTWLEFETDAKDVLYVRIDRTRKVTLTTLLRAFGLSSDEEILGVFGDNKYIKNTIEKDSSKNIDEALIEIYEKLKPGEPATLDSAKNHIQTRFFDEFRYDLVKVGRYKYNKKLNIANRILGLKLAEDVKTENEVIKAGTLVNRENLLLIRNALENGFNVKKIKINEELDDYSNIQTLKVYNPENEKEIIELLGVDVRENYKRLTIPDVFAAVSYYLNLFDKIGKFDQVDHLGNRRVKQVGELMQNQFRIGVTRTVRNINDRMSTQDIEEITPKTLINIKPITAAFKEFFGSGQISQYIDQINPISELTHKRRLTSLGPGGLSKERSGIEVRDVNESHYGRICPIETSEGQSIGLVTTLASYARVNEYGFITTPYRVVKDGYATEEVKYLTADEEEDYIISIATIKLDENNKIIDEKVPARYNAENIIVTPDKLDLMDVSAQQIISVTTSSIPFFEHNDANRTLMGANMTRQAVPLIKTEAPIVGTGVEYTAAKYSGVEVLCKKAGVVKYADGSKILVETVDGQDEYKLANFELANSGNYKHQRPIVSAGDKVKVGDVLADGQSCDKGELALGRNVVVAYTTFNGYNYEDAVILNEKLVKDDAYTSIHLQLQEIQCRDTKLGPEEITRDIPNVSEAARKNLDENGIIIVGTEVKAGDILVGKVTPKGMVELTSEEKLLHAIFGEKSREVRDTSLRVPNGSEGIVQDVKIFTRKDNEEMPAGVSVQIKVYIAQKRKIQVGDKMAGRYGNKGVISLVLPEEDMPFLPDGTPVDILLNPQGVPSRMNIGQLLEMHTGMAAKKMNLLVSTPAFDGAKVNEIYDLMKDAKMDSDGKTVLYDGRTGEAFDNRVTVGVMYMFKLNHMVDDKLHARSTGPYALVTQQPLGGKANMGGQRFGEMEVWALEAYGAANILQEILTVKSDDVVGRVKVFEAIVKGETFDLAGIPESFRVLLKELQALGLDVRILDEKRKEWNLKEIEDDEYKENFECLDEEKDLISEETEEDEFEDDEEEEDINYDTLLEDEGEDE